MQTLPTPTIRTYRAVPVAEMERHKTAFEMRVFQIGLTEKKVKHLSFGADGGMDYRFTPLFPLLAPQTETEARQMSQTLLRQLSEAVVGSRTASNPSMPFDLPADFPDPFDASLLKMDSLHPVTSENSLYPYAGKTIAAWEAVYRVELPALEIDNTLHPAQLSEKSLRMVFVNHLLVEVQTNYPPLYPYRPQDSRPLRLPLDTTLTPTTPITYHLAHHLALPYTYTQQGKMPLCEGVGGEGKVEGNKPPKDTLYYTITEFYDENGVLTDKIPKLLKDTFAKEYGILITYNFEEKRLTCNPLEIITNPYQPISYIARRLFIDKILTFEAADSFQLPIYK